MVTKIGKFLKRKMEDRATRRSQNLEVRKIEDNAEFEARKKAAAEFRKTKVKIRQQQLTKELKKSGGRSKGGFTKFAEGFRKAQDAVASTGLGNGGDILGNRPTRPVKIPRVTAKPIPRLKGRKGKKGKARSRPQNRRVTRSPSPPKRFDPIFGQF